MDSDEVDVTRMSPEEKRKLRMEYISYIPQGSMSVFNPVLKIKETYEDFIGSHVIRAEPSRKSSNWLRSTSWNWAYPKISSMSILTSYRVECASA